MSIKDTLQDKYILCLCEGAAELDIMNRLLDRNLLVFTRNDLIEETLHHRKKARDIEERFLGLSYKKEVVILRIIDSKNEQLKLGKAYKDRFEIFDVRTKPEIEILIIIDMGDLEKFYKAKSKQKPSEFCKDRYKHKKMKQSGFMTEYFDDDRLVKALKTHKKRCGKKVITIYDLLK